MKCFKLKHLFLLHIVLLFTLASVVSFSEDLNGSRLIVGDFISLGHYDHEPIIWQVVDIDADGNPLLFSRRILTIKAFDASGSQYAEDGYYSFEKYYGSNRWETSTVRKWLNSDDRQVKWTNNAPDDTNVFKGENPYDEEVGFLHSSNFNRKEKSIIKETTYTSDDGLPLNDKIFLLSRDEAMAYSVCSSCYPLQHLKHQAIVKPYDIWTRDAVTETLHAVNTLKWDGSQSYNVANVSRSGVAPALKLDIDEIKAMRMSGNGLSYKPYYFALKGESHFIIILCLVIAGTIFAWIVYKLWRGARIQAALMLIGILCVAMLLTACFGFGISNNAKNSLSTDDQYEKYLIILPYALNIEMVEKRIGELYEGEPILVVAQDGTDVTQKILKDFTAPTTPSELKAIENEIFANDWHVVRGGDYRVTTLKKEIDDVFADNSMVLTDPITGSPETNDQSEAFKSAVNALYSEKNYEAIADYLNSNGLQIVHSLDLSAVGIGPLYMFDE